MRDVFNTLRRVYNSQRGQGMAEYGLIIALIAVVVIGVLTLLGGSIKTKFGQVKDAIQNANPQ